MANKSLFSSVKSWLPRATATNEAGGAAFVLAPKHALVQVPTKSITSRLALRTLTKSATRVSSRTST
jgi:hypothetical protein